MDIKINRIDGLPIYRQVFNQICGSVALGLLEPDSMLPSITDLALELGVAPNTISRAYDELAAAGVVRIRRGLGTFVSGQSVPAVDRERWLLIERRIDALLTEARESNLTIEALVQLIHVRQATLSPAVAS